LQEHPGFAWLVRAQLARGGALAQRRRRHVEETRGIVKTNCRDNIDHVQPRGSGRLGASHHALGIIAEVCKKSRGSFAEN
jgi:hypothetical protein